MCCGLLSHVEVRRSDHGVLGRTALHEFLTGIIGLRNRERLRISCISLSTFKAGAAGSTETLLTTYLPGRLSQFGDPQNHNLNLNFVYLGPK